MLDFRGVSLAIERPPSFMCKLGICQKGLQLRPLDDEPGKFSCDIVSNRMMYQQPVPQPLAPKRLTFCIYLILRPNQTNTTSMSSWWFWPPILKKWICQIGWFRINFMVFFGLNIPTRTLKSRTTNFMVRLWCIVKVIIIWHQPKVHALL